MFSLKDAKGPAKLYFDLTQTTFKGLNLIGYKEFDDFFIKQVEDCLLPFIHFPQLKNYMEESSLLLDVGFGGGWPLFILSLLFPEKRVIGLDARKKRVVAVEEMAKELSCPNIKVFHHRMEEVLLDESSFITFKGVGSVDECLSLVGSIEPTYVLFYKGPSFDEQEGDKLNTFLKQNNQWKLIMDEDYELSTSHKRRILLFHKRKNVPRGTKKDLVRASQLI